MRSDFAMTADMLVAETGTRHLAAAHGAGAEAEMITGVSVAAKLRGRRS